MRRPENIKMEEFLKANGIKAQAKYFHKGSMKGCWSIYGKDQKWTYDLLDKMDGLGFLDFDGKPLNWYSGNGGNFSVFVRGHEEFLNEEVM